MLSRIDGRGCTFVQSCPVPRLNFASEAEFVYKGTPWPIKEGNHTVNYSCIVYLPRNDSTGTNTEYM